MRRASRALLRVQPASLCALPWVEGSSALTNRPADDAPHHHEGPTSSPPQASPSSAWVSRSQQYQWHHQQQHRPLWTGCQTWPTAHDTSSPTSSNPTQEVPSGSRPLSTSTASAAPPPPSASSPAPAPGALTDARLSREVAEALSVHPRSLEFDRGADEQPLALQTGWGQALLKMLGFYSKKSTLLHGGIRLYDGIKEQVDAGTLQRAFGLDPQVFFSTYALASLHMWLSFNRLGKAAEAGAISQRDVAFFRQRFFSQFNADVAFRVHRAGVEVGAGKWLKKLETMFFSSCISLDKALRGEGHESVVDVLLIEIYDGDDERRADATLLARYLLREQACLAMTSHEAFLAGNVRFSPFHFGGDGALAAAAAVAGAKMGAHPLE